MTAEQGGTASGADNPPETQRDQQSGRQNNSGSRSDQQDQSNKNSSNNNKKNGKSRNNKSNTSSNKFKGVEESLAVLGVKNDSYSTDNFLVFQRSIETHVLAKFEHSGDVAYLVQELKDPMPRLMKCMQTLKTLKKDYGIDPAKDISALTQEEQEMVKELQELLATERKAFVGRKNVLQSNFSKLFGLLWGQCTPLLQQELRNLSQYKDAYDKRDCLWLLQELKKSASGSDSSQHEFLTYIRTIRTLFTIRQRESESIQDMSDRLDSQLSSLKLIGGDLHPQYLVKKYKTDNPNVTDDVASEAVEEKLLAILTIEGALDSKYGALKRYLANQMVHGVDVYPDRRP